MFPKEHFVSFKLIPRFLKINFPFRRFCSWKMTSLHFCSWINTLCTPLPIFASIVITSYSSNWITLLMLYAPVLHWYCVLICLIMAQDRKKRDLVDLVMEDYDITLCWQIFKIPPVDVISHKTWILAFLIESQTIPKFIATNTKSILHNNGYR